MDAETYNTVVLPIRSKARKAYEQAKANDVPKALLATLLTAKLAAEAWADKVSPYKDEPTPAKTEPKATPATDDLAAEIAALRKANASLKAEQTLAERVAPKVRKAVEANSSVRS
jgi:hypothetical protein